MWRTSRGTPDGRVRSGNSAKSPFAGVLLLIFFMLGKREDAVWPGVDREVTPSRILLLQQSTNRLKLASRSTPMIGSCTSATTNRQVKSRRRPSLSVRVCHPYIGIGVQLDAKRSLLVRSLRPGTFSWGITHRSKPVSTKDLMLLTRSVMNRQPVVWGQASAAIIACRWCFPAAGRNTTAYTCVPCFRIDCCISSKCKLLG